MAVIAPLDAVADAVAWHFCSQVPGLKALRGWPERNEDLELDADEYGEDYRAVLSVSVSPSYELERVAPVEVCQTPDPDTGRLEVLYRVAWLVGRLQLDLWAPYRAVRDDLAQLIDAASANRLPHTSDLRLTSSGFFGRAGYHDRPSKVELRSVSTPDSNDRTTVGEFRRTWTAEVSTDLVIPKTHPKLGSLDLSVSTQLGSISVTDTLTITP